MRRALLLLLFALPLIAAGQGTKADYDRSDALPQLLQGKVYRMSVNPHWLEGGKRFWYNIDTGPGVRETYLVDARSGAKELAFDREKLAKALSDKLGKTVSADRLTPSILGFQVGKIVISTQGKRWLLDRKSYAIQEVEGNAAGLPADSLPAFLPPHPSGSGEETMLTLANQSKETVDVYWIGTDGARTKYHTLKPGDSVIQHTFAGHVWLFATTEGRALAAYEATAGDCAAIFDGTTPAPPQGRRRPNGAESPDGKWRALIRDNDLWIHPTTGEDVRLSTDGKAGDSYGGPFLWSSDGKYLLAVRTEAGQDHKIHMVRSSPTDQLQPEYMTLDYLKPGDKIPHPRLVIFDVAGHKPIPVDATATSNPWDFSEYHWSPDSKELYFVYNQRGHQVLRLMAAEAATGKARTVVEETSPTFIDYQAKLWVRYLDKTGEALWMSERSGYNHIYLVDLKSGQMKPVTQGPWMVRSVESVDEAKRQMLLRIMGRDPKQDPYHFHYARVGFDGSLTALTDGDGTHRLTWAPDGETYLDTYSRVDLAPVTELRRTNDGKKLALLETADDAALKAIGWSEPERFVAKGRDGKTDIWGIIEKPTNFDPTKKYPVIESIYAGPQDFFVPKAFAPFRTPSKIAELGFIVVQIDGMGTDWRGKAFHDVCYQNLADAGFPDRILWMKAAAATRPWMDLSRVGVYGTSAGGQSAASAVMRFGDFYKAAVADCGCHDNRMDKIWWNELWMGWPVGPAYAANSNVTAAKDLKGKLYLMVGEVDTNVDPASTMQVVNALIQAGKDFDLLVYPNSNHGVLGRPYAFRRMEDFFVRWAYGIEPEK